MGVAAILGARAAGDERQEALTPFYTPPSVLPAAGTLIRSEPLGVDVEGADAWRILYTSALPDGSTSVSGGMVFVPRTPAPPGGRPVVAWAHGTIGQGDACAPSRSANPLADTDHWLEQMLGLGWVVVATDYTGLGTPGPNYYLVGDQEARDVVHSVQAVREFAQTSADYAVYGHSQGGHSALWTGALSASIAADLRLRAVAAAAPAAELELIAGAQWSTAVGWVIGPEVAVSWPLVYPDLPLQGALTSGGLDNYERLAAECLRPAALEGLVRASLGGTFFAASPLEKPTWRAALRDQTPRPLLDLPVLLVQGTSDSVVLAWPNAVLEDQWCQAGSDLTALWLGGVNHMPAATIAGPQVVSFIADAFAGRDRGSTCGQPIPVTPPTPSP